MQAFVPRLPNGEVINGDHRNVFLCFCIVYVFCFAYFVCGIGFKTFKTILFWCVVVTVSFSVWRRFYCAIETIDVMKSM